jgi:hypothetical protein
MIRVLLCLALMALASPSRAATVMACQDANGSDWPVSPQHPCPFQGTGPGGAVTSTVAPLAYSGSTSASVGTTSTQIAAAGAYTTALTVTTLPASTTNVWLGIGVPAVVGTGILVQAGGGGFSFGGPGAPIPTGAINAITDGGSAQSVALAGG